MILLRGHIFQKVIAERERQNKLHPEFPQDDPSRLLILLEEVGEVAKALNENDPEQAEKELIEVMASACRWLEQKPPR